MSLILIIIAVVLWSFNIVANIAVATKMSAQEMYEDFVTDNPLVVKILANTYYALAWFLKIFIK